MYRPLLLLTGVLASTPVLAAAFPYATLSVGYSSSELTLGSNSTIKLNGFSAAIGFDLTPELLLDLRYQQQQGEKTNLPGVATQSLSAHTGEQEVGITYHRPLTLRSDIYLLARLARVTLEVDDSVGRIIDNSDNGHTGGIGVRTRLLPQLEGYAEYRHSELGANRSDHQDLGLRLYISQHSALTVNVALRQKPPETTTGVAFYY